jgi:hypothetical protein
VQLHVSGTTFMPSALSTSFAWKLIGSVSPTGREKRGMKNLHASSP